VSQCDVFEKFLSHQKVNKIKGFRAFCDVCDVFTVYFLLLQENKVKIKINLYINRKCAKKRKKRHRGIFEWFFEE
jgi:hypothetical protein